jgi:hypothetical protein
MTTTYTQDIFPKFRPGDITCMSRKGVRIGEDAWMCNPASGDGFDDHANARRVYAALSEGYMPPDGAWSTEWLDTYQRWMDEGFQP